MPTKVDLTPDSLDLVLYAGDKGDFQVSFVDNLNASIDVTAWALKAQIRKSRTSTTFIELTIDKSASSIGLITILISGETARDIANDIGNKTYQWDLQSILPGNTDPSTMLQGSVYCNMDVTR